MLRTLFSVTILVGALAGSAMAQAPIRQCLAWVSDQQIDRIELVEIGSMRFDH